MRNLGNELFGRSRPSSGNFALSPLSAATALAMATEGARGQTQSEMLRTLHFAGSEDGARLVRLAQSYATQPNITFQIANRMFGDQGYVFDADFLARLQQDYQSPLESVDFQHAFEPAREHINTWVAGVTRDRIRDLLAPGVLTPLTRLVLVNALYFRGTWATQFHASYTTPQPFTDELGHTSNVDTMTRAGAARVYVDGEVQVLELPYSNPRFSMAFVVPSNLTAWENNDTAMRDALARLRDEPRVQILLPKFRLVGAGFSLKPALIALGMPTAFGDSADFSGMIGPGHAPLQISDVVQKVFVEVNEEGAEAAAATAVVVAQRSAPAHPLPWVVFRADRPFYFVLRDTSLDLPLFIGRITSI